MAAGPDLMLIAFDYEIVCQRADMTMSFGQICKTLWSMMIKGYTPEFVFITRESWHDYDKLLSVSIMIPVAG